MATALRADAGDVVPGRRLRAAAAAAAALVAFAAWPPQALPDEATIQPAAAPAATFAELQRFLDGRGTGGGPFASTAEYWIDPVCAGYGPGLGPSHLLLSAPNATTSAVSVRPLSRPPLGATEPDQPR